MSENTNNRVDAIVALVERIGFPIFMCVMVSFAFYQSTETQFFLYRGHLQEMLPMLKALQSEQSKITALQEKLVSRIESIEARIRP